MPLPFIDSTLDLTLAAIKQRLIDENQAAGNPVTTYIPGDPTERWLDITPRLVWAVLGGIVGAAFRGIFLDFGTDPGDEGDTAEDQTPRAGFLSARGSGWFGTQRGKATYAVTTVTIQNTGTAPATISGGAPTALAFTTTSPEPTKSDGGRPTYLATPDPTVYTEVGDTLTLAPSAQVTISIKCDQIGSYGDAGADSLVCVSQGLGTFTVLSSAVAKGADREAADLYRARCRRAANKLAKGGPGQLYLFAMNTDRNGDPLQRHDGTGPVNIVYGYVSGSSTTGLVTMYVAALNGGAGVDTVDLDSAMSNILGLPLGDITDPLGVPMDTSTLGPDTYGGSEAFPSGTPRAAKATDVTIDVDYTVKAKAKTTGLPAGVYTKGGSNPDAVDTVFDAIDDALEADILSAGINGNDWNGSVGYVYQEDLQGTIKGASRGLYDVVVATPAADTSLALGEFPVPGTITGQLTVT